jgi:hypothetical protein
MTPSQQIALMLIVLLPFYGYITALAVAEYFAERADAWEWCKVAIDVVCVWVIVRAM